MTDPLHGDPSSNVNGPPPRLDQRRSRRRSNVLLGAIAVIAVTLGIVKAVVGTDQVRLPSPQTISGQGTRTLGSGSAGQHPSQLAYSEAHRRPPTGCTVQLSNSSPRQGDTAETAIVTAVPSAEVELEADYANTRSVHAAQAGSSGTANFTLPIAHAAPGLAVTVTAHVWVGGAPHVTCRATFVPAASNSFLAPPSGLLRVPGVASPQQTGTTSTTTTPTTPPTPPPGQTPHGYWLMGSDGGIFTFGSAPFYGSTGSLQLQRPIVGITPTPGGYWLDASDGGIFAFGNAGFYGSIPGLGFAPAGSSGAGPKLNAPIVGMVPSADGGGYFMVASDGGVFAFGDARFAGSCPGIGGCSGTASVVMPDATGGGYWLITTTGDSYAFGDAPDLGAPANQGSPVVSAVRTPSGQGYWVLLADGAVYGYGDAANFGSAEGLAGADPAASIFATSDGGGYWVTSANGTVFAFGDAPDDGGIEGIHLNAPIVAAAGW